MCIRSIRILELHFLLRGAQCAFKPYARLPRACQFWFSGARYLPAKTNAFKKAELPHIFCFDRIRRPKGILGPSLSGLPQNKRRSALAASTLIRLLADQAAASAVEFALIAIPFFALLLGILELGLMFILNVSLDSAIANFATQVRTGQIQAPGSAATSSTGALLDLSGAKTAICNNILLVPQSICLSQLQLDVRPLSNFQNTNSAAPISGTTFNSTNLCYYSGNEGSTVQITGYYLYSILNPLLLAAFSQITTYTTSGGSASGNFFPIVATQVFRSENYSTGSNTGAGC